MDFHKDYFNNDQIYKHVIKARIGLLNRRKKIHADREISEHLKSKFINKSNKFNIELICQITPPRRYWVKAGAKRRHIDATNSRDRAWFSLHQTYLNEKSKSAKSIWYLRFIEFCDEIRQNIYDINKVGLNSPQIIPTGKPSNSDGTSPLKYRPLSNFDLKTKIIIGLTAKYFINIFDSFYSDCSIAFRKGSHAKRAPTHHDAINQIYDYKRKFIGVDLYVVEYDIRKFFDCINHDILLRIIDTYVEKLALNGTPADGTAIKVLKAYIKNYSFYLDVELKNDTEWFTNNKYKPGVFEWVKEQLIFKYNYSVDDYSIIDIGVPQGGALSCVIANLFLNYADEKIIEKYETLNLPVEELLYLRYCDDMILMHPNQDVCQILSAEYKTAITDLKLLVHEPKEDFKTLRYNSKFWDFKSKIVYKWGLPNRKNPYAIPWVGFVGYQIRYDLKLRVRKTSFEKHKYKLKHELKRVKEALYINKNTTNMEKGFAVSSSSVMNIFTSRLHSLSIGRIVLPFDPLIKRELCWAAGFSALNNNKISLQQLRSLDRARDYQIYRLRKSLPYVKKISKKPVKGSILKYFGSPFSYYRVIK